MLALLVALAAACDSQPTDAQEPESSGKTEQQVTQCSSPRVGWWRGEGNLLDSSGNNNHGASGVQNGATPVGFAAGVSGTAFALNGNSYVQVANAPSLQITTAITVHAWIFANALGGRIIDKITATGTNGYLLDTNTGRLRLQIGNRAVFSRASLPTGAFVHVAGTWDGATGRIYINGVLDSSGPLGPLPNNTLDLRIGADSNGQNRFNGRIDEAAVHNVALSAAQIAAIAAGDPAAPRCNGDTCATSAACASGFCTDGVCCDTACGGGDPSDCEACSVAAGGAVDGTCGASVAFTVCRPADNTCDLAETCDGTSLACPPDEFKPSPRVGWWRGEGNLLDSSGNNNHGASGVQNAATPVGFAGGVSGTAFALNGNSYVQVPNAPNLQITTAITMQAWILVNSFGGRIIDKITAGGANGYLLDTNTGRLRLQIGNRALFSNSSLPTGAFAHVAATWDGTTGRVYINGVLDGSGPLGPLPNNTLDLRIGADSNGQNRFNGRIDEAAVHNVALSAAQIAAIAAGDPVAPRCGGDTCATGAACASGFCTDGVCCDTACGNGDPNDCQACSIAAGAAVNGTCAPRAASTVCRAAAGTCDIAEACNGTSLTCPPNGFKPDLTICQGLLGLPGVCSAGSCLL